MSSMPRTPYLTNTDAALPLWLPIFRSRGLTAVLIDQAALNYG